MQRRQFLLESAGAGLGLAFLRKSPLWAAEVDACVEIFLDEGPGLIAPTLYGHFTEHIGGVIYDGVWVGPDSKISNQYGIRSELIEKMRQIKAPIIRWPGGCFADSYDWKDGVGPAAKRPVRTNFWEVDSDAARLHEKGAQVFESNSFGTNEFVRFCQLSGAEPYLAANLRSLPALSFDQWVEYCNSPAGSTTLAKLRAESGSPDPYKVRFWGVGNESWGCGGNFTPEEYASEFRRFTTWIPRYGVDLQLVGSGPSDNDMDWTHRFFEQLMTGPHAYQNSAFTGWSVHHYSYDFRNRNGVVDKSDALAFGSTDWFDILRECDQVERIILDQWTTMGQFDREHKIRLVVDEYGPWYREGTELDPTHIFGQQITIRDALATALTLDAFNRNAEKMLVGTCAQLINNINALFLCHEDKFIVTPNFHVFSIYAAHQGAQALRTDFSAPLLHYTRDGKPLSLWTLNGSASRQGKTVTLTVVHPELDRSRDVEVRLRGGQAINATASVLASDDMHAHNTFESPNVVTVKTLPCSVKNGAVYFTVPAASVAKVQVDLDASSISARS